jgi:hypothetical protein
VGPVPPVIGPREPDLGQDRRSEPAHLDVGADADPDQPAFGARLLLPLPHPGVVADLDQLVHRGFVVARVEGEPASHRRRELVGLPEVLLPHLEWVHPDLVGVGVDDPLQVVDRLGAPCTAIGVGGHGVGDHTVDLPPHRHLVLTRGDPEPEQRDRHREVLGVGAHVGDGVELVAEELAVFGADQSSGPDPTPPVDR